MVVRALPCTHRLSRFVSDERESKEATEGFPPMFNDRKLYKDCRGETSVIVLAYRHRLVNPTRLFRNERLAMELPLT